MLNERSRLVMEVGRRKALDGTPIYAPHREQLVLSKVLALNSAAGGPTLSCTVEAIWREIMSGSFALERPLRIGYLGPAGSYSHEAATRQFGGSVSYENLRVIAGVFEEVGRGNVDYGLVPIDNTIIGAVAETLDAWLTHADRVAVCAEVQLSIAHALIACPGAAPSDVREVRSKPEALAQCRGWLATQYPAATLVPYPSTSAAVASLAAAMGEGSSSSSARHLAAVGSPLAARLHGLPTLFTDIQDTSPNVTRFLVLCSRSSSAASQGAPSGQDRTAFLLALDDGPGALCSVLEVFRQASINLTHIDKRNCSPVQLAWLLSVADYAGGGEAQAQAQAQAQALPAAAAAASGGLAPSLFVASRHGGKGGAPVQPHWVFFLECEGHAGDAGVASALAAAGQKSRLLKVLGSFPAARRVL
jgi:chorismate mutase/prephenate dehydratase